MLLPCDHKVHQRTTTLGATSEQRILLWINLCFFTTSEVFKLQIWGLPQVCRRVTNVTHRLFHSATHKKDQSVIHIFLNIILISRHGTERVAWNVRRNTFFEVNKQPHCSYLSVKGWVLEAGYFAEEVLAIWIKKTRGRGWSPEPNETFTEKS